MIRICLLLGIGFLTAGLSGQPIDSESSKSQLQTPDDYAFQNSIISTNSFFAEVSERNFYNFRKASKQIDYITHALFADSATFNFGVQSNKKYDIVGITSFYNQPTDILHCIFLTQNSHSFHFQLPILNLYSATVTGSDQKFLEFQCKSESVLYLKEYREKGGLVFSAGYSAIKMPISQEVNTKKLTKAFAKLSKKVEKFVK